jgi:hypothetical protein
MVRLLKIEKSPSAEKKWRASWSDGSTTDFGQRGSDDYTLSATKEDRAKYRIRHQRDHINDPQSPGALAWHLLWGESTSMQKNLAAFRRKFRV